MVDPLEEMYKAYKKQIFQYLYHLTINYHTAEELTQDTFLKAFKSFKGFRGEASIKTWLFTIARNTYLNYINKKAIQLEQQIDTTAIEFVDPQDAFDATNERMMIDGVFYQLPEKYRTIILLRDKYELTYQEISLVIGENEGKVKINLHRARKRFKELYLKENKEGENENRL